MTATFDKIARNHLLSTFNPKDFQYDGTPIRDMVVREINSELARERLDTKLV